MQREQIETVLATLGRLRPELPPLPEKKDRSLIGEEFGLNGYFSRHSHNVDAGVKEYNAAKQDYADAIRSYRRELNELARPGARETDVDETNRALTLRTRQEKILESINAADNALRFIEQEAAAGEKLWPQAGLGDFGNQARYVRASFADDREACERVQKCFDSDRRVDLSEPRVREAANEIVRLAGEIPKDYPAELPKYFNTVGDWIKASSHRLQFRSGRSKELQRVDEELERFDRRREAYRKAYENARTLDGRTGADSNTVLRQAEASISNLTTTVARAHRVTEDVKKRMDAWEQNHSRAQTRDAIVPQIQRVEAEMAPIRSAAQSLEESCREPRRVIETERALNRERSAKDLLHHWRGRHASERQQAQASHSALPDAQHSASRTTLLLPQNASQASLLSHAPPWASQSHLASTSRTSFAPPGTKKKQLGR